MSVSQDINSFLNLMDACFCKIDLKYKSVSYAYYRNELIGQNIPFEEFYVRLCKIFDCIYDEIVEKDLYSFVSNSLINEYVFYIPAKNSEVHAISVSKCVLDDENIVVYFENLETKKSLLNLIDPLTGIYQMLSFTNYVKKRMDTDGKPFALIVMDIDNFKGINDNYGHIVGDGILKNVARVLKNNVKNGAVGRYGGDEFVCAIYQSVDYQEVWNLMYKITHEIYECGVVGDKFVDVSVTVGVSRYGIDGTEFDDLFVKADRALYRGKKKGKDCFIIYDEEKHKNINADGMKKTIIDDRTENYSIVQIVQEVYDILNHQSTTEAIISEICEYIAHLYNVDRAVIYSEANDRSETPMAYFYKDKDLRETMNLHKQNAMMWDQHEKNHMVLSKNVSNLEQVNPYLHNRLMSAGIHSFMRMKLRYSGTTIGSIELDSFEQRDWSLNEKNALICLSDMISLYFYKLNESIYQERKSQTDNLTGLHTYESFMSNAFALLKDSKKQMVLYYLNLEKFKIINEQFSHKIGDDVLKLVANKLKKVFNNGIIARSSGDRFLVFDEYETNAKAVDKITQFIKNISSSDIDSMVLGYIIISCGIYVSDGFENNVSAMIDYANIARKSLGTITKSSYAIHNKKMSDDYEFNHNLEVYLPNALKNEEIKIYLQPKVNTLTGEVIGAEALTRWMYKKERLLSPGAYIPVFERSGLIEALDLYVFDYTAGFIKKLIEAGNKVIPISLNISRGVSDIILYIDKIDEIRKKYNIDTKYIEVEITESLFVSDYEAIKVAMDKLHRLGYKINMDDFGSGYSNLSLLAECEFDTIKLDKSLISSGFDGKKSEIIKALIAIIKNLNMEVVCEGVETNDEVLYLQKLGCNIVQGYYYDRPIPANDFNNKYLKKE